MNLPEYISKDEVKRVCKEIGLSDWTEIKKPAVSEKEASDYFEYREQTKNEYPTGRF